MDIIIIIISVIIGMALGGIGVHYLSTTSREQQLDHVREWLVFAVSDADKYLDGEAGQLKLRSVYDDFINRFPALAKWVPFETFSIMVDDALKQYREILKKQKKED